MSEEIRRLEEKIAFLEHHVTEQDKVMLEFGEELTRLKRELKLCAERLADPGERRAEGPGATDERPPHY